jgi:hypothetical protein
VDDSAYVLKLFVAGKNKMALDAIEALKRICVDDLADAYVVEVIDVLERAGFDGLVCVELAQLGPGVDERRLARESLTWLRVLDSARHTVVQPAPGDDGAARGIPAGH